MVWEMVSKKTSCLVFVTFPSNESLLSPAADAFQIIQEETMMQLQIPLWVDVVILVTGTHLFSKISEHKLKY